ncbi:hypothetical protein GRI89_09505 [Altererythrobacter salegens]|uniref:Uncharacterized protein n=1 Tax=Croceibacterium salegens TaxID=1737568 RepID=A0A6I4SUI4_9SPHN|nr:hypothetical protein [Croceibacterium salegens]MXO59774.1 hypothetical protein [Croceibacterium salegens]
MIRPFDILRLLLGLVMAVTSLAYFLPFLVPFAPPMEWHDPMAVRLMGQLEQSGLLAVAKFISIAGGALLIVNRLVPFALAALMPVNVVGAFISVIIEGDAMLAVLALLTVALNAVLCFAYLHYYRDMLSAGQVADGETSLPGQNYECLFVNPMSGAPTKAYIGAGIVLLAAIVFYWKHVPGPNGMTGVATLAVPAVLYLIGVARSLIRRSK